MQKEKKVDKNKEKDKTKDDELILINGEMEKQTENNDKNNKKAKTKEEPLVIYNTIKGKLLAVQQRLEVPREQNNDYAKFMYRSQEDILVKLKPLLKEYNLTQVITDELVLIGNRYYIKARVTLLDVDSDEEISVTAYAREELKQDRMSESQTTGSTSSYARKYALCGMYAIDNAKDDDYLNNSPSYTANNSNNKKSNNYNKNYNNNNSSSSNLTGIEKIGKARYDHLASTAKKKGFKDEEIKQTIEAIAKVHKTGITYNDLGKISEDVFKEMAGSI